MFSLSREPREGSFLIDGYAIKRGADVGRDTSYLQQRHGGASNLSRALSPPYSAAREHGENGATSSTSILYSDPRDPIRGAAATSRRIQAKYASPTLDPSFRFFTKCLRVFCPLLVSKSVRSTRTSGPTGIGIDRGQLIRETSCRVQSRGIVEYLAHDDSVSLLAPQGPSGHAAHAPPARICVQFSTP